ncbi:putative HIT-like protein [Austwickia sp. TVS 96-490-7B]|uniref:HIT family protein n=1 Tax=Austwickia sp. TVS 96-490-7B TaxID=2830843 RepID=UPI001C569E03|nr:HIT family protein [Austwickia sp. TVS 96-490-7B]MBW3086380.1 putative HIT-like protein [Austwickia sp. TVS 96-490-7B]
MPSIFSRIMAGEIPGRFVWTDEHCVAFLTVAPLTPGHTLVVPRDEVAQWTDADPELLSHLVQVAQTIGRAQQQEWPSPRVGLLAQGFEVPHLHLHVWAASSPADFDLHRADHDPDPVRMDQDAVRLRARLRTLGHGAFVPPEDSPGR